MTLHPVAKRLAVREYIPFGSLLLTWFLIGFSIGPADVVRLIAANAMIQSARALCTLETRQVLARRWKVADTAWKASLRIAFKFELVGLAACILFLAAVASLVAFRDMPEAAGMVAIAALGIPARHPLALMVARRDCIFAWRLGAAATAIAGSAIVFALGLPWQAAALVIGLRDWGGLVATALFAGPRDPSPADRSDVPTFAEAAAKTEITARRQLTYRLVKTLSGVILGPLGNIAARTGRGAGRIDSKLSRLVPRNRPGMIVFTAVCAAVALAAVFVSSAPLAFIVAAAFTRLAASGGSALFWWKYRSASDEEEDDVDD